MFFIHSQIKKSTHYQQTQSCKANGGVPQLFFFYVYSSSRSCSILQSTYQVYIMYSEVEKWSIMAIRWVDHNPTMPVPISWGLPSLWQVHLHLKSERMEQQRFSVLLTTDLCFYSSLTPDTALCITNQWPLNYLLLILVLSITYFWPSHRRLDSSGSNWLLLPSVKSCEKGVEGRAKRCVYRCT